MAFIDLKILYPRDEFVLLPVEQDIRRDLFLAFIAPMVWSVPIIGFEVLPDGAVVQWAAVPSENDLDQMAGAVAAFPGGVTSSAPIEVESLAVVSTNTGALVDVIDTTTPMLEAGTYAVEWTSLVGMLATVANTGVRGVITLSRIRGAAVVSRQYEHNWTMQQPQLFGAGLTFTCAAGDKIRALLQVQKLGVAAATAQMGMARISIDRKAVPSV